MFDSIAFIDPHVHADSRSAEEFPRLKAAGCVGLVAVSGPGGGFSSPDGLTDHFRRLHRVDRRRLQAAGLQAWVAIGAHPGGIPERDLDRFLDAWPEHLKDFEAAAVGEVGLDAGGEREERVLTRAFDVAAQADLPVILHTPRQDKPSLLARSLELLAASKLAAERVLVDHLDADSLDLARQAGCWLGLSVHPAKLSADQVADLIADQGAARVLVDSDAGANPSYLFALPAAISALRDRGVNEEAIRAVVHDHAAALLGPSP